VKTSERPKHSKILILDFGSQYTQVIARRIRECQVYSEIIRFDTPAAEIAAMQPKGLILSGGPASVYDKGAPQVDPRIFSLGIPILTAVSFSPGDVNMAPGCCTWQNDRNSSMG
jgi:GMP synthase (glutamine-hydrolysing)